MKFCSIDGCTRGWVQSQHRRLNIKKRASRCAQFPFVRQGDLPLRQSGQQTESVSAQKGGFFGTMLGNEKQVESLRKRKTKTSRQILIKVDRNKPTTILNQRSPGSALTCIVS
uniref:Uncharacterized protein n=1 Tax=Arundo donax TaxID=35708 RepID=A0A0A9EAS7_ARUDO